jgi:hypothetical protein
VLQSMHHFPDVMQGVDVVLVARVSCVRRYATSPQYDTQERATPLPERYNLVHASMSGSPLLAVPIARAMQEDP